MIRNLSMKIGVTHNSMEPKPTSPIVMLKFLIIWSLLKGKNVSNFVSPGNTGA